MKCSRRFATRAECSEHVVTHLRAEKAAAAAALQEHNASEAASSEATKAPSASTSPAPMDLTVESSQAVTKPQPTDATTITEQDEYDEAMLCAYMREDTSEHAEDVECGQAVTDVVNQIYEDRCRKRTYSMVNKEEKHSHTVRCFLSLIAANVQKSVPCVNCSFSERLHQPVVRPHSRGIRAAGATGREAVHHAELPDAPHPT